jgi:hypothetical protein
MMQISCDIYLLSIASSLGFSINVAHIVVGMSKYAFDALAMCAPVSKAREKQRFANIHLLCFFSRYVVPTQDTIAAMRGSITL